MIYADNAATTKLDSEAFEAMKPYLLDEYGNPSEPYSFSRSAKRALKDSREIIASCINAAPDEIFFTSGGTESDNWALKGTMFEYGDTRALLTSTIEHHAVLQSAKAIERMGYPVIYLPVDKDGIVHSDVLKKHISDSTKLVSIMFSNNEIGSIQPIKELTAIAHQYGALFHTDAVQAVGHIPIDVKDIDVDMLSASAHKFNGPKGVGFLYIKKGTPLHQLVDGGAQEYGMRAGTENIASIVGMATALKNNCKELAENSKHLEKLEAVFLQQLNSYGFNYCRNGSPHHTPGNLSLSFKDADGEMLLHRLDLKNICVSTGSACNSKRTEASHVLKAIHLPNEYAKGTIRISVGKDNTIEDVISIAEAISSILNKQTL